MTKTISVRLDEQSLRALKELEATHNRSRSETIREALLGAVDQSTALRREVARLAADPRNQQEVEAVQALMDELSEPW